ncbi:MAG: hypothetical protein A3G20_08490 [Acidobacteria bacterium RIFCSPLOWO2_12_FULL_59_11]|nr:MAG: hypothetical protein A3G20_08490 [Acidobacteria bacterium RIFCSPLOWO2_12_FULL_59_11]
MQVWKRRLPEDPWILYDRQYYKELQSGSAQSATKMVPELIRLVCPKSVVDVGCGLGAWLAEFQKYGVADVLGIDGGWVDKNALNIQPELFLASDLCMPLLLSRKFDLALTLEVAEHLPSEAAEQFVSNLVALAPLVVFSAAIPYQGGDGHLNEQWPDYWATKFATFGYQSLDYLRFKFWDDHQIDWWYRQNIILYVRHDQIQANPRLKTMIEQQPPKVLRLVHPENYTQWINIHHEPGLRWLLKALPSATVRMIKRRLR